MRRLAMLLITGFLAAGTAGCTTARARTVPEPPALEPPPPPPRLIQPIDLKAGERPAPQDAADAERPSVVKPSSADRPRAEKPKPDPSREAPPQPKVEGSAESAQKPLAEVVKPPLLQTPPAAQLEAAARVRDLIDTAQTYLDKVDYTRLNADGRSQYDTARRFMVQALEALNESNLVYATKLADKAATLARLLPR
ncbi:MAG: hypothetical protein ACE148_06695 [Vicinamibacterales bacterium]